MKPIYSRFMLQCLCSIGVSISIISCGGDNNTSSTAPTNNRNMNYESVVLAANSLSVTVAESLNSQPNTPYVSVTICEPGTYTCKTIHNIMIDTGSSGLRIFASAVKSLNLGLTKSNIYECAGFGSGVTWGTVQIADIQMAGELASSMAIQVIDDGNNVTVPSACSNGQPTNQTPAVMGANGLLGVSNTLYDTGPYFDCIPSASNYCLISPPANYQIQNPIAAFAVNNNGLIIRLPQISAIGATTVTGSVIFGIDTQANNSSNGANFIPANSNGNFTTIFNNVAYPQSYIDSGTNYLVFSGENNSSELPICSANIFAALYCPTSTKNFTATMALKNNVTSTVNFSVATANLGASYQAFNNIAGPPTVIPGNQSFVWGLPFFFGRSVYVGIAGKTSNAGTGPYFAYTDN